MTRLAKLIATAEGFFRPGSLPQRFHNPGDLRHGPHCEHDPANPNGIGRIDCDQHGWEDLERQLQLYAGRGLTLRQAIETFAPPDENNTAGYLDFVVSRLGCSPDAPLKEVLAA